MAFSEAFLRKQLNRMKPMILSTSLEVARKGQDAMGEMMYVPRRRSVKRRRQSFEIPGSERQGEGEWILPLDETSEGVVIYLHGGGYACGSIEYARGFGKLFCHFDCVVFVVNFEGFFHLV
jgi:acetyl esterase/lipase